MKSVPARRKVEYVPLAREVYSHGGRDLRGIHEAEIAPTHGRDPPLKEMGEWGAIETDALVLSIRSRVATEMSYALTTLAILSTMKGQTPGSGFPIQQCGDLLEELLDLVEELAFDGIEDNFDPNFTELQLPTYRQLTTAVHDGNASPFSMSAQQGDADPTRGISQRPGNVILLVITILRNFTTVQENVDFMSTQYRLVELALRLSCVTCKDGRYTAASPALSLSDVIVIRRDTLTMLGGVVAKIQFPNPDAPDPSTTKMAVRLFQLIASYLVDPAEAISPFNFVSSTNLPPSPHHAPPQYADQALDVFTRLAQGDGNRQVFSKAIPHPATKLLLTSLVRRLPFVDNDFTLVSRESWISYVEKLMMSIYSVVFLAPPELKRQFKSDRQLGMKTVLMRTVHKFALHGNLEVRHWFSAITRRAIETLKLLDDETDMFEVAESAPSTLSFGMGWGDATDADVEAGSGMLSTERMKTMEILMQREVVQDAVMFNELMSLTRVECAS